MTNIDVLTRLCPICKADPGKPCLDPWGIEMTPPHYSRTVSPERYEQARQQFLRQNPQFGIPVLANVAAFEPEVTVLNDGDDPNEFVHRAYRRQTPRPDGVVALCGYDGLSFAGPGENQVDDAGRPMCAMCELLARAFPR